MAWIAVGAGALLLLWLGLAFNRLVPARNAVREAWAQIDVQLSQRAVLVPRLVAVVAGYAGHERAVLDRVAEARGRVETATGPRRAGEADDMLGGALGGLYALAEAYPDLKADDGFLDLQRRLTVLEDDIASARRYYNALVQRYANARQAVPTNVAARLLHFDEAEYFKAEGEARQTPAVETTA